MTADNSKPQIRRPASGSGRRQAVLAAGGLILACLGLFVWKFVALRQPRHAPPAPQELNVLLITLDTTRADSLGCYGRTSADTPVLNRLAKEGTLFTRCTTCSPQTLPAHSSIMTGLYPFVHGVRRNGTHRLADRYTTLAEWLAACGFRTRGVVASFVLNAVFGIGQGFETFHDVQAGDALIALHAERKGDDVCADAIAQLRSMPPGRFLMWVHFYDPHYPYESARAPADSVEGYADEVSFMDRQIGRLLEELKKRGLDRRTLIAVVGDHGEAFGEHDERQHGYFVYDATLRVPLLFHCPGLVPAGRRVEAPVRTIDVAPTILDLIACDPLPEAQGVSLRGVIDGAADVPELAAYGESLDAHLQFGLSPLRSLSIGSWKYILSPQPELYNTADDPAEERNVVGQHMDTAADLRERMRALIAESAAPPAGEDSSVRLGAADLARLQSLGYVGGPVAGESSAAELDLFEPRGGNPRDFGEVFTRYCQSHWALMAGDFSLAEQLLQQVIKAMPDAARVRADLAYVLQHRGRMDDAQAAYRQALAMAPRDTHIRRMYAGLLVRRQQWNDVVRELTAVVAEKPDDFEAQYNLGIACGFLRRFDDARRHLELALKANPKHASSLHAIGATYLQEDNLPKAAEYFRKALAVDPSHARSRQDLARIEGGTSR